MLRTLLLLVAILIIAAIGATYMGWINLRQTQQAQAPKYELDVKQVEVPTLTVSDGNTANAQ